MEFIDVEELINNGSGVARQNAFSTGGNTDAVAFDGTGADRSYFTRPIPDEWQGQQIRFYVLWHHVTGALTGTGSPPDDQIRLESGWETLADQVAYVDLGVTGDGTAPHENNENLQLGVTTNAVLWHLIATVPLAATDRFFHGRITRDAIDTGNDGLAATALCMGCALVL